MRAAIALLCCASCSTMFGIRTKVPPDARPSCRVAPVIGDALATAGIAIGTLELDTSSVSTSDKLALTGPLVLFGVGFGLSMLLGMIEVSDCER
jgi:hypothetical protein